MHKESLLSKSILTMRFGILKLLTLHSIKIEDKDQQVPKGKTQKKGEKSLKEFL